MLMHFVVVVVVVIISVTHQSRRSLHSVELFKRRALTLMKNNNDPKRDNVLKYMKDAAGPFFFLFN